MIGIMIAYSYDMSTRNFGRVGVGSEHVMQDKFVLSAGQAHELEMAMNREGNGDWTKEDVKVLSEGNLLGKIWSVIRGKSEINPAPSKTREIRTVEEIRWEVFDLIRDLGTRAVQFGGWHPGEPRTKQHERIDALREAKKHLDEVLHNIDLAESLKAKLPEDPKEEPRGIEALFG